MDIITSAANKNVLRASSLKDKKYRDLHGLYLIEGKRAVYDALKCGADIAGIFVRENSGAEKEIIEKGLKAEIFCVSEAVMKKICGTVNPQEIAATVKIKPLPLKEPQGACLLLDRICDPGNLGTIIRTAAACGYYDIYVIGGADPYNPKAVRASMGGINFVRLYFCAQEEAVKLLKGAGCKILGADMGGQDIFGMKIKENNFAVAIGSEADGLSDYITANCGAIISLPMENVESLNAAVCASVMMYALRHLK